MRDARTINSVELTERRIQAVKLYKKGLSRIEIGEIVGVHRNTVGEWLKLWQLGGTRALKARDSGRPFGSGRMLSAEEEKEIKRCIVDKHPDQLKLPFALWTREAVRLLIKEKFGVKLAIRTVGEYLKRWGFTPQKPVKRAYERCEKSVQKWLKQEYPAIKKKAEKEGSEIHWGDETGIRSDDVNGRGYAPKGKTPVRRAKGSPERLNMISSITNQGKVRFMFYKEKMNSDMLIKFMRRLIRDSRRRVVLILDNLRVHHSKIVKEWLEENKDFIEVHYLPSYSPDLNPDEYLNNDLKAGISMRPDFRRKGVLKKTAKSHMMSIQRKPERIKKLFQAESIKYAS
jgi:transposase